MSILHHFRDIITYFPTFKEVTWPWTHPFRGQSIIHALVHLCSLSISTRQSKCLVSPIWYDWGKIQENWSRDPDHAHCGVVCHPKASIWYILPAYKIWRLSLQPFWRYDCANRNWKSHVAVTTPLLGVVCQPYARIRHILHVCKVWPF